jgi:transcriptional antiterminator
MKNPIKDKQSTKSMIQLTKEIIQTSKSIRNEVKTINELLNKFKADYCN